jgi:succinylglutamate desuccinylase
MRIDGLMRALRVIGNPKAANRHISFWHEDQNEQFLASKIIRRTDHE